MALLKQPHAHYIIVGDAALPLIIKKHPRARSIVVRYDAREGCVRVSMPRYASVKSAVAFAQSRAQWVARQMEKAPRIAFSDGAVVPLFGVETRLMHVGGRGLSQWVDGALHVTGEREFMARRVRDAIVKRLQEEARIVADRYAGMLGVKVKSIRIGDMRSRWGSCNRDGDIALSLRLAFAPALVFEYVVCHEVSHIMHLNHSERFWRVVESLCPDYRMHEAWLSKYGSGVWAFG